MKTILTRVAVPLAATAALATAATAATPESGSVSKATPKVQWDAATTGSYFVLNPMNSAAADVPCEAPSCDAFALTVADDAPDLEIVVNAQTDAADVVAGVRVERPDGTVEYGRGPSSTKSAFKFKIKNATKGDYQVGIVDNSLEMAHKATAALIFPAAAAPEPEPGASPAPGTNPQPQPQPQPQPGAQPEGFTVDAKVGKVSARKARKGKTIAVKASSSRAIERMTVTLKKGKKALGSATAAPFPGTGTLKLKLKSALKKGTYSLLVVGNDGSRNTGKTIKIKVVK